MGFPSSGTSRRCAHSQKSAQVMERSRDARSQEFVSGTGVLFFWWQELPKAMGHRPIWSEAETARREREECTVFSLSNFSLAHITDIAFIFMCPLGPWVFYFLFQYQLVFSRLLAWSKLFAFIENNTLPPPFFLKIHRVLKIPLVSPSFLSSSPSDKPNSILCSLPQEKLERAG